MNIICNDLHKYKNKIVSEEDPNNYLEEQDSVNAFRKHEAEIKMALEKHKRVYLIVCSDFELSGVFKSPNQAQLVKSLNKSNDGFGQNSAVCKLMACNHTDDSTFKMITAILSDKDENVPATLVISIGNILLNREGIGITELGK